RWHWRTTPLVRFALDDLFPAAPNFERLLDSGRGIKDLPVAFDLAGCQEFAFVGGSLNQFLDTQNSIPEAR
ncbi:hypothetical protein OAG38_07065, partial [Akkermansiaceae bacterium]|nr:hypothetical protein [Akkermansiaceae bacterium]